MVKWFCLRYVELGWCSVNHTEMSVIQAKICAASMGLFGLNEKWSMCGPGKQRRGDQVSPQG